MAKEKKSKTKLSLNKKGKSPQKVGCDQNILTLFQKQAAKKEENLHLFTCGNEHSDEEVNSSDPSERLDKRKGTESEKDHDYPVEKKSKYFVSSDKPGNSNDQTMLSSVSKSSKLSLKRKSSLRISNKDDKSGILTSSMCSDISDDTEIILTKPIGTTNGFGTTVNGNMINKDINSSSLFDVDCSESSGVASMSKFTKTSDDEDTIASDQTNSEAIINKQSIQKPKIIVSELETKPVIPRSDILSGTTSDPKQESSIIKDSESEKRSDEKTTTSDLASQEDNMVFDPVTGEVEYKIPYYLENFMFILDYVMTEEFYVYLFNDKDNDYMNAFKNLSENSQKLYVRLFGRQFRWIRKNKIVYPKIADDLTENLLELCSKGFVLDESSLDDLSEVLKALPAPDLKLVGKSLRLNVNLVREELVEAIIKHTTQSNIGSFFKVKSEGANNKGGIHKTVLTRAKKLLCHCYKLDKDCRSVFMRVMMLFGLHNMQGEEDERGGGQQQLFQMLMSNIGRVKYPEYKVYRETKIFQDRAALQRFSSALQMEVDIGEALEKKEFDSALEIFTKTQTKFQELKNEEAVMRHDQSLPNYLRRFTAGSVYTRILSYGVELYQFTKKYDKAVELLKSLIEQGSYHKDYRGRWYERLVLNLDHHLKKPAEALDLVKVGLSDENIRLGHRLALFQRAQKICNAVSNKKLKKRWSEFSEDVMACVHDSPKVFIKGRQLQNVAPGGFAMFISDSSLKDNDEVTFLKRVEDVALNHYKEEGYSEGLHAEGSIFSFLQTLYMWEIVFYDQVPDVFYNLYQAIPLDLYTLEFYDNRKEMLDNRLQEIKEASLEDLLQELEDRWEKYKDTNCLSWDLFRDVEHAKGLVTCMGGSIMAAIFDRMVKDRRFTRSGVPDLTIWNPDTKKFKIVEVKGPGDRLSTKQILWIDYLLCLGIDAEVCHVQAVGAKKLH